MTERYATLVERNEWEAETWRFYIPVTGNEDAIDSLNDVLTAEQAPLCPANFVLVTDRLLNEDEVDARVAEPDRTDYLPAHNKLTGKLLLYCDLNERDASEWGDVLYKGGIRDLMETP